MLLAELCSAVPPAGAPAFGAAAVGGKLASVAGALGDAACEGGATEATGAGAAGPPLAAAGNAPLELPPPCTSITAAKTTATATKPTAPGINHRCAPCRSPAPCGSSVAGGHGGAPVDEPGGALVGDHGSALVGGALVGWMLLGGPGGALVGDHGSALVGGALVGDHGDALVGYVLVGGPGSALGGPGGAPKPVPGDAPTAGMTVVSCGPPYGSGAGLACRPPDAVGGSSPDGWLACD
jgi:hypothetical protein